MVTFIKDNTPNGSYADRFYSMVSTRANRSFTTSTYDPVNVSSLPHSTSLLYTTDADDEH